MRLVFSKGDRARFLSHLDLVASLEYAVRRAGIPVALSEGFNPRPRMSIAAPLALGHIGKAEVLDIVLREPMASADLQRRLQGALPTGIAVLEAEEMPSDHQSSASRVCGAQYLVTLTTPCPALDHRIVDLLANNKIEVEEKRQDNSRQRDIRPLILGMAARDLQHIEMRVRMDNRGSVRPETILKALDLPAHDVVIARECLLFTD